MRKSRFILAAAFLAASASLQAAGAIKTYLVEAAFASDETVDWIGLPPTPRDEDAQLPRASNRATSPNGSVAVNVRMALAPLPNPSPDGRLVETDPKSGRLTVAFTSGPVMGVGVRIQANGAGPFTHRMNAYDAAGNLLGTATVSGMTTSARAENASPFVGLRSNVKEIAKVEVDAASASGFTISGVKLGLKPITENDWFFVNQQFQDLYGRAPYGPELMGHLNALKQGSSTRAQVAATLFLAPEFHNHAGFLVKCYLALMQRDPDFVQWSQILRLMQSGATQDNALTAFMNTPEYAAVYPASMSDGSFVTKLYQNLLGRDPESADLESWLSKLANGTARHDMVLTFLRSPEFEVRIATRVDTSLAYLAFLRRTADPAGMNRWTEALKTGSSITDLIGALISLPEYVGRF
jgi:hypothetical protein